MAEEQRNTHSSSSIPHAVDSPQKSASSDAISPTKSAAAIRLQSPEEKTMQVLKQVSQYDRDYHPPVSVLDNIFPNKEARKVELMKCKTIHERYEFELRVLQTFHDAQMQFIHEKYQAFLLEEKAKIRKERTAFFQEQLDDLTNSMSQKNRSFLQKIYEEYQALEQIPMETLRKKQEEFIEKSIDRYYETATQLIEHFQSILTEDSKPKR